MTSIPPENASYKDHTSAAERIDEHSSIMRCALSGGRFARKGLVTALGAACMQVSCSRGAAPAAGAGWAAPGW